jgi:hypothetical protein
MGACGSNADGGVRRQIPVWIHRDESQRTRIASVSEVLRCPWLIGSSGSRGVVPSNDYSTARDELRLPTEQVSHRDQTSDCARMCSSGSTSSGQKLQSESTYSE